MTATSAHPAAASIVANVQLIQGYYHRLLDGVTPETFAMRPEGLVTNHPAFLLGHVPYYSGRMMTALGAEQCAVLGEDRGEPYTMQAECLDDPAGEIYLPMDESIDVFDRTMEAVVETLPGVDAERLEAPPEGTSFAGIMPTMAAMANFVLVAHPMTHAGQLSAWRRCMGLGPCKLM